MKNRHLEKIKRGEEGFTFLEIILTIMVLSFGLIGTMALFQNATRDNLQNDDRVIATQLANEKIETIIADRAFRGYSYIVAGNYAAESPLSSPHAKFSRSVTITEVSESDLSTTEASSGYKKVDVVVTWNGGTKSLTISTVVTNYS